LETAATNKKVFMEACFWKTTNEAIEVIDGYDNAGKSSGRQKTSFWSEDDEEKLGRLFEQFNEMKKNKATEEGEMPPPPVDDGDIADNLESMFMESGKTRRQIIKKLKDMNLIQNVSELKSKKSGRRGTGGSKKRVRGEKHANSDEDERPRPQETDAQGNPIYKSKQWIESDDDSSDDETMPQQNPPMASISRPIVSSPDSSPEKKHHKSTAIGPRNSCSISTQPKPDIFSQHNFKWLETCKKEV